MWTSCAPTQPRGGHLCLAAETKGMWWGALQKPVLPGTPSPARRRQADAGPAPSARAAARRGANEKQGERQETG